MFTILLWTFVFLFIFSSCKIFKNQQDYRDKERLLINKILIDHVWNNSDKDVIIPGGMMLINDTVPCNDFSNKEVKISRGKLNLLKPCPPISINVDSIVKQSILFKDAILKLERSEINLEQQYDLRISLEKERDRYRSQRNTYLIILSSIGLTLIVVFVLRINGISIPKFKI